MLGGRTLRYQKYTSLTTLAVFASISSGQKRDNRKDVNDVLSDLKAVGNSIEANKPATVALLNRLEYKGYLSINKELTYKLTAKGSKYYASLIRTATNITLLDKGLD